MAVSIVNKRILTANAGTAAMTVGELKQLIVGLADEQRIALSVHKGYSDPRESSPDSIELTINDPRPAGNPHLPHYPPGVRGGPYDAGEAGIRHSTSPYVEESEQSRMEIR